MDAGTLRGLYTALLLLIFIGICVWAYSKRRKSDFEEAANLPLEGDDAINKGTRNSKGADA